MFIVVLPYCQYVYVVLVYCYSYSYFTAVCTPARSPSFILRLVLLLYCRMHSCTLPRFHTSIYTQATSFRYPPNDVRILKTIIGDAITKHVTVGQVTSVRGLGQLSATATPLRRIQVERAMWLGFETSHHASLEEYRRALSSQFLTLGRYMSTQVMGAVAEAINHTVVIWVAHPTDKTALIVHHLHSMQGGGLAIHSPRNADGVIHLRFYKSGDQFDHNVFQWGAGHRGHFELLCKPVNGWPQLDLGQGGNIDRFTPRRGPHNQKRGAKTSPGATSPEPLAGKKSGMTDQRSKVIIFPSLFDRLSATRNLIAILS